MRLKHTCAIRNYHLPPFILRPGLSSGPFLLWASLQTRAALQPHALPGIHKRGL